MNISVYSRHLYGGIFPPKVLYSPKGPSKLLHRTLDTAKRPPKVSDSSQTTDE